jgi:hypothetical protein
MDEPREHFGLRPEDLNIDPGQLGDLLPPPDQRAVAFGIADQVGPVTWSPNRRGAAILGVAMV